jgi:hypothetical protein
MSEPRRTDTKTLVTALRILSREIHCEDGVATAAIAEGADRIEELLLTTAEVAVLGRAADLIERRGEQATCIHVAGYLFEDASAIRGIATRMGGDA